MGPQTLTSWKHVALASLALLLVVNVLAPVGAAGGDYEDSGDAFWQEAPPPPPKSDDQPRLDPATGRFLQSRKIRFIEARLRPDSTRTMEEAEQIAEELEEAFLYEGLSHNNATAASPHQISIESYESWQEIRDIVFSVRHIYDVVINSKSDLRDDATVPFSKLWKEEMGKESEPLAERFEKLGPGQMPEYLAESLAQGKATPELEEMLQDAFNGKTGRAKAFRKMDWKGDGKVGGARELKGREEEAAAEAEEEQAGEGGEEKKGKWEKKQKKAKKAAAGGAGEL